MRTLSSCHRFSIGFASGLSGGVLHQLMLLAVKNSWAFREVCMFGIIVLHESMTVWVHTLEEGYQSMGEDPNEQVCSHDPYKNANLCTTPPADSCPYMYFDWMLGAWLATWF